MRAVLGVVALAAVAAAGPPPAEERARLKLAPFYEKYVNAGGFPIVASGKVDDYALREARYLIDRMLDGREDIRKALIKNRVRFTVMAHDEFTTDVPEHSDLKPARYWDRRARGLGATWRRPSVSCGAENLLGYPGDPYSTENILIHEFAHAIHEMGLNSIDPTFDAKLRAAYQGAMKKGLWKTKYAATNRMEYWAEGVQSWFDTNRENDNDHNHVDTRAELKQYDPDLAKLIEAVFGDREWRYVHPRDRKEAAHLEGYDPKTAPRFRWPKKLQTVDLPVLAPSDERRSKGSGSETSITFINHRGEDLALFWIDSEGKRKHYATVRNGRPHFQTTFAGHAWELVGKDGRAIAHVVAGPQPGRVVLK